MIIAIPREMAVAAIQKINNDKFYNTTDLLFNGTGQSSSPPNWTPSIQTFISIFPEFLGPIAFLLLFLIPFGMMWMSHGNMKLLGILGFIVGGFVLFYLPANFIAAAVICMAVSVAGFLWGLFKQ